MAITANGQVVIVAKTDEVFLVMGEIRSWLDIHKIEPAVFMSRAQVDGTTAFEISFDSEQDAESFDSRFG